MSSDPRRILIVDPAFLGDAVFDAALARAAKTRWPGAEVGLVVRPPADQLAARMPHVDRVHVFDKRGADRGLGGLRRVASALAEVGYDLALIPHPSLRSTWLAARAGIPERVGSAPGWLARRWLTRWLPERSGDTFVGARLRLIDPAWATVPGELGQLGGVLEAARPPPAPEPRRVGLVLGSEWATKRWPVERAAELLRALDPERHVVVFLGAARERPLFEALTAVLGGEGPPHEDAVGGDLGALLDRLAGLDVLVAGDTGPLHMARALGVPTVALFGPTPEDRHWPAPADRVLTVPVDCRPCSPHGQHRCPKGHHRCLVDLGGGTVAGAVRAVLEGR